MTSAVARRGCNEETQRILPNQYPCSASLSIAFTNNVTEPSNQEHRAHH